MFDYSRLSKRAASIAPSGIRRFFDIVSEMPEAISLGVGEPDFVTPWAFRASAIKSVQKGFTQYTSNWGIKQLREEIAGYLRRYNLEYSPDDEILVTVGASEGIDLACRAILNDGDEVVVPSPSYVAYKPCVALAGGVPVPVKVDAATGFKLTPELLNRAVTRKTKAVILPYPNNPSGGIMEREYLEAIAPVILKHDLLVISDEIYSELTYGGRVHISIASLPGMRERTIVLNGFSKAFAMTGWRVGFAAAPRELIAPMVKIHQHTIMCAPTASQYAALGALVTGKEDDYAAVLEMHDEYDRRRRFVYSSLCEAGLECFEPMGAFYVFPNVEKATGLTGARFAEELLEAEKVAVVPGDAFGSEFAGHVRICYAMSMKALSEALGRIGRFVKDCRRS